jgi:hypothetical protein
MKYRIKLPDGPTVLNVCKDGDGNGADWADIYEQSFPSGQRQAIPQIRELLRSGAMELDETRDETGRGLCMTLTEVFGSPTPEFLLACYTATRPELRSLGIGSLHRTRLLDLLKTEYPTCLGFFSEIESTHEPGLSPEALALRRRRLTFFLRLGVERIPIDYQFPSYHPGEEPLRGKLLWIPFGNQSLDRPTLVEVLKRIYIEGYGLSPGDPFIPYALTDAERPI